MRRLRRTYSDGAVEGILKSLGIEVLSQSRGELIALCPGHKDRTGREDHNPSWSINEETGVHLCFSCGYKGNVITLVRDLKGEAAADSFAADVEVHGRFVSEDKEDLDDMADIKPLPAEPVRTANFKPESWLSPFGEPPRWALNDRRISATGAKSLGVLWDEKKGAWIFPLREPEEMRLLGYQSKSQRTRYFRNRPRDVLKSHTFFGWPTLASLDEVVVVESPLDSVLLSDYYVQSVAICGSRVSEEQMLLLSRVGKVHMWLDNDTAGRLEHKRLRSLFVKRGIKAEFITPEGFPEWKRAGWKDVGEMPDDLLGKVLDASGF